MLHVLKRIFAFSVVFETASTEIVTPSSNFFNDIDGISVAPGMRHICVLEQKRGSTMGGRARCWGDDDHDRTAAPKNLTFVQLASGHDFSCGITIDQMVHCWGDIRLTQVSGLYSQITAADFHGCGVMTDGTIHCWGHLEFRVPQMQEKIVQISCSRYHCCVLNVKAHVSCFGVGTHGEMHPPTEASARHHVSASAAIATNISARNGSSEALSLSNATEITSNSNEGEEEHNQKGDEEAVEDEDFYEDDYDDYGEGEGNDGANNNTEELEDVYTDIEVTKPASRRRVLSSTTNVPELSIQFKQISVDQSYSCGISLVSEDLHCWGKNKHHEHMPRYVRGPFKQVSVGAVGVCAIRGDHAEPLPAFTFDVGSDGVGMPAASSRHWGSGTLLCWGYAKSLTHSNSVLSHGTAPRGLPASGATRAATNMAPSENDTMTAQAGESAGASGPELWMQVSVGFATVCSVAKSSLLMCWGVHSPRMEVPKNLIVS